MSDTIDLGQRCFNIGGPVPKEGIIIGAGGGFTLDYSDFLLLPTGTVALLSYVTLDRFIPQDTPVAQLLKKGLTDKYDSFVMELERINFVGMESKPAASDIVEYVVVANQTKGLHGVLWAKGSRDTIPTSLRSLVSSLRSTLAARFHNEHGS
jgi:hypothetical protein